VLGAWREFGTVPNPESAVILIRAMAESRLRRGPALRLVVIPAEAGIQCFSGHDGKDDLDPGLRRDDEC
jgi:hypothetical protein